LACILNLSFYCGLRRKEIPNCKIKSTFDSTTRQIREKVLFGNPSHDVEIPLNAVSIIENYLDYFRFHEEKKEPDSPLFPAYDSNSGKESSQEKKLTRHLDAIFSPNQDNDDSSKYPIMTVRKLGIKSLYVSLPQSHSNENSIFSLIAQQYWITPREVQAVIYNKIVTF